MRDLLFLTQRIPYPPIKGEKIRPLQILRHLRERYRVHLGCLVDDPDDQQHEATVAALCTTSYFARLDRRRAKLMCLTGLLTGAPLSVTFYRDGGLGAWVRRTMAEVEPAVVFVCSSNMAPYVLGRMGGATTLCDLADVDSEKWRAYSETGSGPMRLVHRREWRRVAALEGRIARELDWSTFVSAEEAALFRGATAGARLEKIRAVPSGVDFAYFDPAIVQAGAVSARPSQLRPSPGRWIIRPMWTRCGGSRPRSCRSSGVRAGRRISISSGRARRRRCGRWPAMGCS